MKIRLKLIILYAITAAILCGCGNSENISEEIPDTEINEGSLTINDNTTNMEIDDTKEHIYTSLPYFYQDSYDIKFGEDRICDNGNLLTCLSMLESYYLDKEITPDVFVARHSELCSNGYKSLNADEITNFIETLNVGCIEEDFSVKEAVTKLKSLHGYILVYIPHTSIYGKGGSYLIIAGTYNDYFIVHDPSKISEDSNKASETKDGEMLYNATQFTLAASKDSKMWVIY